MDELKTLLAKAAPWLAAAAAGPAGLAAQAIKTVARSLGQDPSAAAGDVATALAGATPEQLQTLRNAENDFRLRMQSLGIEHLEALEALAAGDRKDARAMQVAQPSRMPALLSLGVTAGYFVILVGMLAGWLKASDSQALLIMLGSLGTAWGMVMAFWFGTTSGSARKTDLLAQSQPAAK